MLPVVPASPTACHVFRYVDVTVIDRRFKRFVDIVTVIVPWSLFIFGYGYRLHAVPFACLSVPRANVWSFNTAVSIFCRNHRQAHCYTTLRFSKFSDRVHYTILFGLKITNVALMVLTRINKQQIVVTSTGLRFWFPGIRGMVFFFFTILGEWTRMNRGHARCTRCVYRTRLRCDIVYVLIIYNTFCVSTGSAHVSQPFLYRTLLDYKTRIKLSTFYLCTHCSADTYLTRIMIKSYTLRTYVPNGGVPTPQ